MKNSEIIRNRLINQQIAGTKLQSAQEVVSWMVAMQSQEYSMAKWAIGLRLPELKNDDIERAFNNGDILRTHIMRPTWHFVTPNDIRWMLVLTAPRVNAANAYYYRKFELDESVFKRSNQILIKELQGGNQQTRMSLKSALEQEGIIANGLRLSYIMMRAELDGIVCSGSRQGKQFTYALLEERVPPMKSLEHEEALGELTKRYFASRGPATLNDFAYWSGLTMTEAKIGISMLGPNFTHEFMNGQDYIFTPDHSNSDNEYQKTFLMPDYDEYGMSYKDRSAIVLSDRGVLENQNEDAASNRMIIIDGIIKGTWKSALNNKSVDIKVMLFTILNEAENQRLEKAIKRYKEFFA